MADLYLHGQKLESVFELLGTNENDITYSIGWTLAHGATFLDALLSRVFSGPVRARDASVSLQEYQDRGGGFTDIEITGRDLHVIVEAKRGWWLPGQDQLSRYALRLAGVPSALQSLVVMSECSPEYAALHLPREVQGIKVCYLSWKDVARLARPANGTHAEKGLLRQLRTYLGGIVRMQDQESNLVYVVALGAGRPGWSKLSWIDIVKEGRRYFHPFGGKGWPKEPPNYLAFRYGGRLASIHHVEAWKVVDDMHTEVPEIDAGAITNHVLYTLGEPIVPPKVVRTGKIYPNGRVRAMLDLLLTCDTISQARDLTQQRLSDRS